MEFIVLRFPELFLFWSVLSVTVSNLVQKQMDWYKVSCCFSGFLYFRKGNSVLKNWGPFSYGTCDFGKLTEWRWLGGKVLCVVFAGMMLAFVPQDIKEERVRLRSIRIDDLTVTFKNG